MSNRSVYAPLILRQALEPVYRSTKIQKTFWLVAKLFCNVSQRKNLVRTPHLSLEFRLYIPNLIFSLIHNSFDNDIRIQFANDAEDAYRAVICANLLLWAHSSRKQAAGLTDLPAPTAANPRQYFQDFPQIAISSAVLAKPICAGLAKCGSDCLRIIGLSTWMGQGWKCRCLCVHGSLTHRIRYPVVSDYTKFLPDI
ncbi:hypothetical protein EVAR_77830_1 [Eumeta japonica]|uniref:Uncharacterized protein n=1 Tax=Eumeta variegata TaxID=151549 RepID=A0A4C1TB35_EUMVA|nr:hypothetical protein EVAR_77830_1 [Eumeta japonica]